MTSTKTPEFDGTFDWASDPESRDAAYTAVVSDMFTAEELVLFRKLEERVQLADAPKAEPELTNDGKIIREPLDLR
jgi:hypothetical protein